MNTADFIINISDKYSLTLNTAILIVLFITLRMEYGRS